ncbi:MAG: efflux RND transporter periplasmic adaptor subunit [Limisphaerales bacterium]
MNPVESGKSTLLAVPPARPQPGATVRSPALPAARRRLGKVWLAAALTIGLALLAGLLPRWKARALLRQESADLGAQYVTVVRPQPGGKESALVLPGEVRPFVEAPIYARTSGYLKQWYFDIGRAVTQGQLLAEIDTPEVNQQLAQARAELTRAAAALELARTTAARWEELLKTASVSEQEAAEKTAALATGSAAVEAARANVRRLEELQSFERVVAPFDGVITERKTDIGQLVNAGAGVELFRLAQTRTLRVFVRVPQTWSQFIVPGQTAELLLTERPDRAFPAKIVRTAGAIDPDSRTLLTELQVDNERGEVLAGAYAQVRFQLPADRATLVLPANTLLFRAEGLQAGVVGADGRVELRTITLGRDFGTSVEVLAGVTANDRVILNPSDSLAAGSVVRLGKTEEVESPNPK